MNNAPHSARTAIASVIPTAPSTATPADPSTPGSVLLHSEIVARIEDVRRTLIETTARWERLEAETRQRRAVLARQAEQAQEQIAAQVAQLRAAPVAHHQEAMVRTTARYNARKQRIQKAQINAQKRRTQQIDQEDGREVFGFQKGTLDAEKRRQAELSQARETFNQLNTKLAEVNETWAIAEAEAWTSFGTFGKFRRWLSVDHPWPAPDSTPDEFALLTSAQAGLQQVSGSSQKMRRQLLPAVFRFLPLWLIGGGLLAAWGIAVYGLPQLGRPGFPLRQTSFLAGGALVLFLLIKWATQQLYRSLAEKTARELSHVRHWLPTASAKGETRHQFETDRIQSEFQSTTQAINEAWSRRREATAHAKVSSIQHLAHKTHRVESRHEKNFQRISAQLEEKLRRETDEAERSISKRIDPGGDGPGLSVSSMEALIRESAQKSSSLLAGGRRSLEALARTASDSTRQSQEREPAWTQTDYWSQWTPPRTFTGPPRIGTLLVNSAGLTSPHKPHPDLLPSGLENLRLPVWLGYPDQGSVVIETDKSGAEEAVRAINNLAFRLLCQMPPGRLRLTVLDPTGLGQSFATLMHLADYSEAQGAVSQRIWTEGTQIEARLAELTEHMEKVIQMYLRNEFKNILEYNAHAGSTAERHHLLLVTGFPVNFSDTAARRLVNLIANGPRCGIITLLHWDRRHSTPLGFVADELSRGSVRMVRDGGEFALIPSPGPGVRFLFDSPPPPELATDLLHRIGRSSRDANKVEVPFSVVAPPAAGYWAETTADEIRVPIGRTGAAKLQYLALGRATRQHALISGKTGSGKSNLLHVIVVNLALRLSPREIEFYLVDFKKGVEFKAYASAQLPHARVIAIESDREFGLSVLERLDQELRRRGELFRELGVQDLAGYRQAGGKAPLPRCLLLVDEFQEYFVQEDRISQTAAVLLDRIVRQGRAFGIHVILASQTLGGTYALARATLGQMAVRIAFQCDEADAYLIMGDENPAPKLLSRPGEGIYNDAAGALEANSPFQAVWLPDDVRDQYISGLRGHAQAAGIALSPPVVFEGSAPASIETNEDLTKFLTHPPTQVSTSVLAWLGAPNSIKGPTAAVFSRTSGSNLLIVGQREDAAAALLAVTLISLAAQHTSAAARFVLVDTTAPGSARHELLQQATRAVPHAVERALPGQLPAVFDALSTELTVRSESGQGLGPGPGQTPSIFVLLAGLQNCKKIKPDDSFGFSTSPSDPDQNAAPLFQKLYSEGPSVGIHIIAAVDTYNNVNRYLGRKGLSEFEMRVLFQMSATDSSSLIDQPAASQLGLYGALYYNDREGQVETFRPYAAPESRWFEEAARLLQKNAKDTSCQASPGIKEIAALERAS